jgi:hypothetical protein
MSERRTKTPVSRNSQSQLLSELEALIVTSLNKENGFTTYKRHLRRVLDNTELEGICWVNFNRRSITQLTLSS